jgi:hypothetical protein
MVMVHPAQEFFLSYFPMKLKEDMAQGGNGVKR